MDIRTVYVHVNHNMVIYGVYTHCMCTGVYYICIYIYAYITVFWSRGWCGYVQPIFFCRTNFKACSSWANYWRPATAMDTLLQSVTCVVDAKATSRRRTTLQGIIRHTIIPRELSMSIIDYYCLLVHFRHCLRTHCKTWQGESMVTFLWLENSLTDATVLHLP